MAKNGPQVLCQVVLFLPLASTTLASTTLSHQESSKNFKLEFAIESLLELLNMLLSTTLNQYGCLINEIRQTVYNSLPYTHNSPFTTHKGVARQERNSMLSLMKAFISSPLSMP